MLLRMRVRLVRFNVGAQHGVNSSLVTFSGVLEKLQHVRINS